MLVEALLARGEEGDTRGNPRKEKRKSAKERPEKERDDDSYVSANIYRRMEESEGEEKEDEKGREKKKKERGRKFYPPPRDSAEIRARSARPCDAVYYAFAQEGACIRTCTVHDIL